MKFSNWEYELKNLNSFSLENEFSILQRFQIFDYYNWLPNNLLVKLDRCLMTFGMEGRTPFIDKELFKKLFYLDDKKKINKGYGKFYIRNFLNSRIPEYNFFKKKKGFSVPIYDWIPKKVDYLEELLLKQEFLREYFSKDELKHICKATKYNKKFSKPLWHIIFFTSWYLVNILGLEVKPGDLIHADFHGAMVVKAKYLEAMPDAIRIVTEREKPILKAARKKGFNVEKLKIAWNESQKIK